LNEKPTIQKIFFSLLLVVFTISFIPKAYFHEVLADHKDFVSCEHPGAKAACIHQQGFRCDVNDLVVTTPYVLSANGINFVHPPFGVILVTPLFSFVAQHHFLGTDSRGPPSVIIS
jgi:hypothetical protein